MRKLKFLLLFFLPLSAFAQLDKLKPGMPFDEVKKIFPKMIPDASAMSSWIYTRDSLDGIKGTSEYLIQQDTLLRYDFTSDMYSGPCSQNPDSESSGSRLLIRAAVRLSSKYINLFGKPAHAIGYPYFGKDSLNTDTIYTAKWVKGSNILTVTISRPEKNKMPLMNAPPQSLEDLKPGCKYTLEILSIGTGNYFQKAGENGITGYTFKQHHPNLAEQVENHPDSWIATDTLTCYTGAWRFTFESKKLDSYSLNITDGNAYCHKTDSAYSILKSRTIALFAEAKKGRAKPDTLINRMLVKYAESRSSFFRHTTYFTTEWKYGDKKLFMIFDKSEGGKQFDPIFHLLLFYGRSSMEL